jgi:integrase
MAGLPGEFFIRRTDFPRDPDKRSWRSLPAEVIRALDAALPQLEASHTREMRVAVELLMDTGRRPDEVCQLPLACLDQDERGPVLIYTDFKTNHADRRLPISTATAELIRGQQQRANAIHTPMNRNLCCCPELREIPTASAQFARRR